MRATLPLLLVAASLAAACTEASSRYTTRERQIEARTEGDLDLFFHWIDSGTLVAVAPLHAAVGRRDYTRGQLESLTHSDGPRLWVTISLWRFAPGGAPLALGAEGVRLVADTSSGKVESLPPSKLLARVDDPGERPLLAALTGSSPLPALESGHWLQLLAALPTDATLESIGELRATLPTGTVALERAKVAALQWDELRSQPSRERAEALLTPAPPAPDGTVPMQEGEAGGSDGQSSK